MKVKSAKRQAFAVGDVEVEAGARQTIDLPFSGLSTHTPMNLPVHVVHGRRDGPRLFVCAALHGDEINGVEIIRRLLRLSALKRLRGTLVAVPIVNIFGFVEQSRYLPDRRDLNRVFPGSPRGSLAGRLAHFFMREVVARCTHGIDLHTAAVHRSNFPQIRGNMSDPEAERLAKTFGVPVQINTGFRNGSLREAAHALNVPVVVYEAGEALRFDELSIRIGVRGVVHVMRGLGMLPPSKKSSKRPDYEVARSSTWVRAPQSGLVRVIRPLGSRVRQGDRLGLISDPFGANEVEVLAPAGGIIIGRSNLPTVLEGDALFHIARFEGIQAAAKSLDAFEPEAEYESGVTAELNEEPAII